MEASEQFCLRWTNHQQNLRTTMSELLQNQSFTDVTLSVEDGHSVQCHKMILAASSPYFESLFAELPYEHPIVVLNDVKYREIIAILEYMYKGEVNVPGNELPALFKVAETLEIKGLVGGNRESSASHLPQPEVVDRGTERNIGEIDGKIGEKIGELSSPPHSTSSPYYLNGKSPISGEQNTAKVSPPAWPYAHGFTVEGHNSITAAAALQSSLSARYSSLLGTPYDNGTETVPRRRRKRKMSSGSIMMNRSTPILRTALNQGQADSSQSQIPSGIPMLHHLNRHDSHYRSHSNGSANNDPDDKQNSVDNFNSQPTHSPYESETSIVDEDEGKVSRRSLSEDGNSGVYGSSQKHGSAKRYKQYTHTDIAGAIAAVIESGMSANKAAALFRVPSRTLYDKISRAKREDVKNGGSVSTKRRRNANNSGACFPYGIGGNATGSIYGNYPESDNDNGNPTIDNSSRELDASFPRSRDNSIDRDTKMEIVRKTPSPRLSANSKASLCEENENEAEDLSVKPKSQVHVIVPPGIAIKEAI